MSKITAKVLNLRLVNDNEVIIYLDCDQIWGEDEIFELKVPIRIVAEMFGLDHKDVEKSHDKPYKKYPFSETKEFIKEWDRNKIKFENKRLTLE